jgi:hypothetical protein
MAAESSNRATGSANPNWAKERHEKDIDDNDYDKPMTKHHRIGPSVWGLSGIPI